MADPRRDGRDPEFERALERMYAQTPVLSDSETFASGVEAKLARSWRLRTTGIWAAGVVGGVIAASQLLGSGLALQVRQASVNSMHTMGVIYRDTGTGLGALSQVTPSAALFWAVSGLMILAAVIGATRVLDEV